MNWRFSLVKNGKEKFLVGHGIPDTADYSGEFSMFKNVFFHTQMGVAIGGPKGKTLDLINPAFAEMHGYSIQELTGALIGKIFAPEEKEEIKSRIEKIHQKGYHSFTSVHQKKDWTTFPVLINAVAIKNLQGEVQYRIVNVIDITEEERSEKYRKKQIDIMSRLENYSSLQEKMDFILDNLINLNNNRGGFFFINLGNNKFLSYRGVREPAPEIFYNFWKENNDENGTRDFGTLYVKRQENNGEIFLAEINAETILFFPLMPGQETIGLILYPASRSS